jgi:hypothetical protein
MLEFVGEVILLSTSDVLSPGHLFLLILFMEVGKELIQELRMLMAIQLLSYH